MASEFSKSQPDFRMAETRWTQVIRSKGNSSEAKLALKDLAEAYYQPVFWFIKERSPSEDAARDLTQEFFARVLDRYGFDGADPNKGRFRSFLLGAVKHFLADQHAYAQRQKRGGGRVPESLDASDSSFPGIQVADENAVPPDEAFDRLWATAVLERSLGRLEKTCASEGKEKQFEVLQPWLAGGSDRPQAEAAFDLGMSESSVRVAIHRLRQRFRKAVLAELAQTVGPEIPVQEEMQHLFAALSR